MDHLDDFQVKKRNTALNVYNLILRIVSVVLISGPQLEYEFLRVTFYYVQLGMWCLLGGLLLSIICSIITIKHTKHSGNKFFHYLMIACSAILFVMFFCRYFI